MLDLSDLDKLVAFPDEIRELAHQLLHLNCSGTQVSDLAPLRELARLTWLDCSHTPVSDLEPLRALTQLTRLDCNGTPVAELEPLRALTQLTWLECSPTPVSDLEPLRALTQLTRLDCSHTPVADLEPLRALARLTELDCRFTKVTNLEPLRALAQLTRLDCSETPVSDLEPLRALAQLTHLYCSNTQVSDLEPLRALTQLTHLYCSNTQVTDLEPLRTLAQLTRLDCSHTPVAELEPLHALSQLTEFYCGSLRFLCDVPTELTYRECSENVRGYFRDLEAGQQSDRSARVLLVGNGFAGKSTLAHCLVHGGAPPTPITARTHAIVAQSLQLDDVEARLSDFAGQEMYHATHRLFLRAHGIFVLLWTEPDPNDATPVEERHSPGYWLDLIQWFGSGPIIVVKNKVDVLDALPDPPELNQRAHIIAHRLKIAAGTNHRVGVLRAVVHEELLTLVKQRATRIGASWARARNALAALEDKHISRQAFDELTARHGVLAPAAFLTYLVNTGHVFYAADAFGGQVFLDQSWIVDATYRLFEPTGPQPTLAQLQNGGAGTVTGAQLRHIVWPQSSEEEVKHFLAFLTASEIVFELDQGYARDLAARHFVIPALLPEVSAAKLQHLRDLCPWSIHLEFTFPLIHRALVERLLVRSASRNRERQWWRNTAFWHDDQTGCNILFEAMPAEHRVMLRVAPTRNADLAEGVARLMLLIDEVELHLHPTLRLSANGEQFATIDALTNARRANTDVASGDCAVSQKAFAAVYHALGQPIPALKESGYGRGHAPHRAEIQPASAPATTIINHFYQAREVTMGDSHKTSRTTITSSTGVAVTYGDQSNATTNTIVHGSGAPTQEEHEKIIDDTQIALIQSRRELDAGTWEALDQFLRIARDIQVNQHDLMKTQAMMKDALDDVWAQQEASKLRSPILPEGLAVAKAIASNPVMQEVAKKLIGL